MIDMVNVGKAVCSIVLFVFCIQQAFSQAGSTTLNKLEVTGVYAEKDYDGFPVGDNEYRWRIWLDDVLLANCIQNSGGPGWYDESFFLASNKYVPNILSATYDLKAEAWEEDGCDGNCTYNTCFTNDDDGHCGPNSSFLSIGNYQPGVINTVVNWPCTSGNPYAVRYEFSYNVPKPQQPAVTAPSGQICDPYPTIELSSTSFINNSFIPHAQFYWEYRIGFGGWSSLGQTSANTNGGKFSFWYIRFLAGLTDITSNTDVYFRVKTHYTATNGAVYESVYSDVSSAVHLSPLPPTINTVTSTPSCPNQNTGTLTVNVSGFGEYLYILRPGENASPCNPELGNCGGSKSGRVFSNTFTITGVAPGRYTLIVANRGSIAGVCWSYTYVDVAAIPTLQLDQPDISSVSCQGGSDGMVELTSSGGITPWTYTIAKTGFSANNTNGIFNSLTAGNYNATVTDGCSQLSTLPAAITQPRKVEASVVVSNPFCNTPADGTITVTVTQGEGRYSYKLLKNSIVITELNDVTLTTWLVTNLAAGSYTVEVKDAQRLQCEGFSTSVDIIAAPSFQIIASNITSQNLTCFESNNGAIHVQLAQETEAFNYILSNTITGSSTTTTIPNFTSLAASTYSLAIVRNREGCLDRFDHPGAIAITQPEKMVITLNKSNITCNGLKDGKIISSVAGATSTDHYTWETRIGTSWSTLSSTATSLLNLSAGRYRLRVNNNNACTAEPQEATIEEPQPLSITSVNAKDIVCFGELGEIEAIVQGGIIPYHYTYVATAGTTESTLQKTPVAAGLYKLEVSDVNHCHINYANALTITSPPSALALTFTLSDFNGYNVSCAGGTGYAQLTAMGGGGSYLYALDGNSYQANSLLKTIPAGTHQFAVKDSRGCVVTHTPTLTEPGAELSVVLVNKNDVTCYGDKNGLLSVVASGGVEPYSYKLFQNLSQSQGTFSSLPPGEYTITVADRNGCSTSYHNTIDILSTPMSVLTSKKDVSCYGGSDGTIETEVSGGTLPLRYEWINNIGTAPAITNLQAGDYSLHVTDNQGCQQEQAVTIHQPEKLTIDAIAIPVCVGKTNGEIRLKAHGGTNPYQYSVNAGSSYQTATLFTAIAAGTYDVRVKDAHQCETSITAEVKVRNDRPAPDFIVATKQNALDTLVIHEISVPKPDSIEWTFDPAIKVLIDDVSSPEIMVDGPGDYAISLKGYFGGCEYSHSVTLNINPFDPQRHNGLATLVNGIKGMTVTPNPNAGVFEVSIELETKQHLALRVMDVLGTVHFHENWEKTLSVTKQIDLSTSSLSAGIYVVQAITDTDAHEVRIVINH